MWDIYITLMWVKTPYIRIFMYKFSSWIIWKKNLVNTMYPIKPPKQRMYRPSHYKTQVNLYVPPVIKGHTGVLLFSKMEAQSVCQPIHSLIFFVVGIAICTMVGCSDWVSTIAGPLCSTKHSKEVLLASMLISFERKWNSYVFLAVGALATVFLTVLELGSVLIFGAAGFLCFWWLLWRGFSPSISQYLLHWWRAMNWSIKEMEQLPLKPLYL